MSRSVDPIVKHRRDVWLFVFLPVALATGLILLALVVLFIFGVTDILSAEQINVISSIMLTVCILFPLVLVVIGINAAMIFLAWGTRKLPTTITPPLRSIRKTVENISETIPKMMSRITNPLIAISTRWTRWEYFMRGLLGIQKKSADTNHDLEVKTNE
jgi:hypothetical protein